MGSSPEKWLVVSEKVGNNVRVSSSTDEWLPRTGGKSLLPRELWCFSRRLGLLLTLVDSL